MKKEIHEKFTNNMPISLLREMLPYFNRINFREINFRANSRIEKILIFFGLIFAKWRFQEFRVDLFSRASEL